MSSYIFDSGLDAANPGSSMPSIEEVGISVSPEVSVESTVPVESQATPVEVTKEVAPAEAQATAQPAAEARPLAPPEGIQGRVFEHYEVAKKGETLSGLIMRGGIDSAFMAEDIAHLSATGKQNLIFNIVDQLTPEQLRSIGVISENKHLIHQGQRIDLAKLAEMARSMTVTVGGEKVSLITRALQL